jgi:spermidine synthase
MLTIDNTFMCTERDEANYHEMIIHPAALTHGKIANALIIGGGDGGTARELLRHNTVKEVTLVEIDENVIDASKQYLPTLSSCFSDPRLKILIDDGIKYIKEQKSKIFDMIIVDSSDPVGPAEGLFTKDFYTNSYNRLDKNGVLVIQGESPYFNTNVFTETFKILSEIFGINNVKTILFHIPSYPSGTWSFHVAHKGKFDPEAANISSIKEFCHFHQLKYYNEEIHRSSFCLPSFVKDMLKCN